MFMLPLGQDAPIGQVALHIVLDDHQDHRVSLPKVPVGVLGGVEAQAGGVVRQGAEHPAAVFPTDDRLAVAAQRMALPRKGLGAASFTEMVTWPEARSYSLSTQSSVWPGWYFSRRSE